MSTTVKTVLILGLVGLLSGGAIAYCMYNKPHRNVLEAEADYHMTAVELYQQIENKSETAAGSYNDKIFELTGTVAKTDIPDDSTANVFLAIDDEGLNNVICAMDLSHVKDAKNLKPGTTITIKGIFSGVNAFNDPDFGISTTDIMLTRCVVKK